MRSLHSYTVITNNLKWVITAQEYADMNAEMQFSFCLGFYVDMTIPPCNRIAYASVRKVTLEQL